MVVRVFRIDRQQLAHQVTGPGGVLTRAVARLARRITNNASQRAPVDTGNLRRMIATDPITFTPGHVHGGVTARAKYSRWVHDGTSPHVIRPRGRKALRFTVDGRTVFARYVNHPGTRARPFLLNAAREEISRMGSR
ncbi:HK97 gp10 family phage protein [Nocardia sp. CDC159]|uniref:HK97 gp10 family phage protein n=1 Tax=Nocardia pulmonis TaxID=2951408 RepID=A0A9X2IWJ2_9NOCA|nr:MULTISPECIES: HK97 gp10 family phage protein [Nocardia]MCM6774982.1 HK97 gp10 family phage protein [Nocardia pulmonis]MCM6789913.1 HK97 gp10 family phage protein [Nocardia sp. CDC159]